MDAVELPFPAEVAAHPKRMGAEGMVRAGVTVKGVEGHGSDSTSIFVNSSIECCNSRLGENGVANVKNDKEFLASDEPPETELHKSSSQVLPFQNEEVSKSLHSKGKSPPVITSRLMGVPVQQKAGNISRNNSSGSKRQQISQLEDYTSPTGIEDVKVVSDKLGSHHVKCSSPEKTQKGQLRKQKSNAGRRGDKKNFKAPAKAKTDSSSIKLAAAIFSSCGGNNISGMYGLKHDMHDVTKLVDEQPLDELLMGTFDCPSLCKDKGKKAPNMNEGILSSVKKACSILFPKPVQSQNMAEMDNSSNKKMSGCQMSSASVGESSGNGDKGQSCTTDMSSCQKDSSCETDTPANPLDFTLYQPKDVLERIALPPSKNLESLLLDASKPITTKSNNNDLRSGKQMSRRPSLPAFQWSHAFGTHCRTNTDAVKLSASRSTCQGKWAKIGFFSSSTDIDRGCFTDLDSFSYDQSLVPSVGSLENKVCPSVYANLPFCQWTSSSPVTCSKASQIIGEIGGRVDNKKNDGHSTGVLVAAQTLYDIATCSMRQNPDGIVRWQKKTSLKTMKTGNLKSSEKLEGAVSRSISVSRGSGLIFQRVEQIMPSKKRRLSIIENKEDSHSSSVKRRPCAWPSLKSSRSLPSKSVRDSGRK